MLKSKQTEMSNTDAELNAPVDNWLGRTFFESRRTREKQEDARTKAAEVQAASVKRSRMRVKAANEQRAARLKAEEMEAYKAVFDVEIRRPLKRSAAVAERSSVKVDRKDPSTWRRPNLDNLKASILADWKGEAA